MKQKTILFVVLIFLTASGLMTAAGHKKFEFHLSYGGWTLGPFTPLVETRGNEIVDEVLKQQLGVYYVFVENLADITISPEVEQQFAFTAWYRLNPSWAVGVRVNNYNVSLPYSISAQETLSLSVPSGTWGGIDFQGAEATASGSGLLHIKSVMFSILGRGRVLASEKVELHLMGGLNLLPLRGRFQLDLDAAVHFPSGASWLFEAHENRTLEAMRKEPDPVYPYKPPALLIAPSAGISLLYKLKDHWGLTADITISEGTFFTLGLFYRL